MEVELPPSDDACRAALAAFLALTPQDRLKDTPHVYAYYRETCEEMARDGDDPLDMVRPAFPAQIWDHVRPVYITVDDRRHMDEDAAYISIECRCAWEGEHGLMMVWRHGRDLVKVGPYDGHLLNSDAYGDDRLLNVVFHSLDPRLSTHRR